MIIMGDFNAVEGQLSASVLATRAGWQDLSSEGTCLTSSSTVARRIDQVWGFACAWRAEQPGVGPLVGGVADACGADLECAG